MPLPPLSHAPAEIRVAAFLAIDTEHGRSILRGIAHFFRHRHEVTVLKFGQNSNYDPQQLRRLRLSGIIAKVGSKRDEEALLQLGVPVINVSGQREHTLMPTIDSDDARVGEMAFHHFQGRGHRRFAYCGNPKHHASVMRLESFRRSALQFDPQSQVHAFAVPLGDQNSPYPERIREQLATWVKSLPKPIGIFSFTDRVAVELEEVCVRNDIKVPDEVALLGVGNDLTRLEFSHVELSSVQLNTERIGLLAAESLDQCMKGQGETPPHLVVPPQKLVIRRSSDRYAVSDEIISEALDYMRMHIGNSLYVSEIARVIGLSRRSLEIRFRQSLGESVYEAVQRMKIDHAKDLLADPSLSVGEIAFSTGYADHKAFARAFRSRVQESPSSYRRRLLPA